MLALDVIDMLFPRSLKAYDKLGYKNMIKGIKALYFGNTSYKMTRRKCEEFFENDNNFAVLD